MADLPARDASDPPWHTLDTDAVAARFDAAPTGLGAAEAARRFQQYGPNQLRVTPPTPAGRILVDQFRSVVVGLLAVAAAIAALSGELLDAAAIGLVLVINTALGFVTELRARRAIEALSRLEPHKAFVLRDGERHEIPARELVPGDVIELEAGAAVPADARVLQSTGLRVTEAPLTGESAPVGKHLRPLPDDTPLADRANLVFSGTMVADGAGRAMVVATGSRTEIGRIGGLVGSVVEEKTPLEQRLDALGRRLVWLAVGVAALVVGLGVVQGKPGAEMLMAGLALAVAAVPEGLPAVATIALAIGVRRMARRHALVRRLPAVESLGSVTVVCTDKTGTLTAGEMTARRLHVAGRDYEVGGAGYEPAGTVTADGQPAETAAGSWLGRAIAAGVLAGRGELSRDGDRWIAHGDPTDVALLVLGEKTGLGRRDLLARWPEEGAVPFTSTRKLMATFHHVDGNLVAMVKGAPDRLLEICDRIATPEGEAALDEAGRSRVGARNEAMAADGLRVIGLAAGRVAEAGEAALTGLTFLGLAGLMDPPAEGVKETIAMFRQAGVRTVMVTGDQRATARAVGLELGLFDERATILSGSEFERLSDEEIERALPDLGACTRVSPEAKLRLVAAFQRQHAIVSVLGDGVNDAAALKKADVGVAMGGRGTDVARETADVVLQDDWFPTIGAAVEEGRAIFDNIRKFVFYLFSCNVAEVMVLLIAGVAGWPLPLTAVQILWLNLVTDTFPALSLALERPEDDVMQRPPRDPEAAILSARFLRAIGYYAGWITAATLAAFLWMRWSAPADAVGATTMAFMTLALAQLFHLGNARSRRPVLAPKAIRGNRWALAAVALVLALQWLAVTAEPLRAALGTRPLSAAEWMVAGGLAVVPAIVGQATRALRHGSRKAQ